ncbi:MAG: hypothetical protein AB1589_05240 [Cyanobacteriota bacterium]
MNSTHSVKTSYEITLSQEALAGVETVAQKFHLSVSELLERIGSGQLAIVDPGDVEDIEEYLYLQDSLDNLQGSLAAQPSPEYQEHLPG